MFLFVWREQEVRGSYGLPIYSYFSFKWATDGEFMTAVSTLRVSLRPNRRPPCVADPVNRYGMRSSSGGATASPIPYPMTKRRYVSVQSTFYFVDQSLDISNFILIFLKSVVEVVPLIGGVYDTRRPCIAAVGGITSRMSCFCGAREAVFPFFYGYLMVDDVAAVQYRCSISAVQP